METLGFFQSKNDAEETLLLKRMNSLLTRIAIKNLAISSRLVKHKKMLACSSAKTKLHQKSLKARYLMAICENIISKNDIPKELYKSFREWHLQSIIKKLKNLSENQKDMLYQQKTIVARHLRNCITKILTKTFYQLRRNVGSNEYITEKLSYTLSLNDLVEKISAPFLKHSLLLYPRANWNSNRMDTLSLLKVCQFFKKLQTFAAIRSQNLHDKSRGALILQNVLQNKMFCTQDSKVKQGFLILETLGSKPSQELEQRALQDNKSQVKTRIETLKLRKFKNLLGSYVKDHLGWAFQFLKEHTIENSFTVEAASKDTEISSEAKVLLNTAQNQALINAKLEKSYQRKALEGMTLRHSYQQQCALAKIIFKDKLRIQHNHAIVKNIMRNWQSQVEVPNSLLQVLQNEINAYQEDITQIVEFIEELKAYIEFLEGNGVHLLYLLQENGQHLTQPRRPLCSTL